MKILIFEKPVSEVLSGYRGTNRYGPFYVDTLSGQHPVNKAFLWYVNERGKYGFLCNYKKSLQLLQEYERLDPPQYFELVEVAGADEPFISKEHIFIGYDTSAL